MHEPVCKLNSKPGGQDFKLILTTVILTILGML